MFLLSLFFRGISQSDMPFLLAELAVKLVISYHCQLGLCDSIY